MFPVPQDDNNNNAFGNYVFYKHGRRQTSDEYLGHQDQRRRIEEIEENIEQCNQTYTHGNKEKLELNDGVCKRQGKWKAL